MERSHAMAPSSEGTNPLRPYYKPPSIGIPADTPVPGNASGGAGGGAFARGPSPSAAASSIGSSARGILSDLDYDGLLGDSSSRSTGEKLRGLIDQAMWRYSTIFLAQPFEVAKTVLQVYNAEATDAGAGSRPRSAASHSRRGYVEETYARYHPDEQDEDDDDDDEPSYFTSNHARPSPSMRTPSTTSRARPTPSTRQSSTSSLSKHPARPPYQLLLRRPDSVSECLSQLWAKEGAWGFWKGTNVTFLYSVLLKGIETWTRSMLAALFNLPDPGLVSGSFGSIGGLDIVDSPSPFASLVVAVSASAVASVLLAPLDMIRTRIIVTPVTSTPRSILPSLRLLSSWSCSPTLLPLTLMHSTLPTIINTTSPLFLRSNLGVDPIITPTAYSACTFLAASAELFLRLPFETVLRRGQMKEVQIQQDVTLALSSRGRNKRRSPTQAMYDDEQERDYDDAADDDVFGADPLASSKAIKTIVPLGQYYGILPTMWRIVREEGTTVSFAAPSPSASRAGSSSAAASNPQRLPPRRQERKGQGVYGLVRGWRVGWWGLVGIWSAAAIGGGRGGGEF